MKSTSESGGGNDENCITLLHFDNNVTNASSVSQTWDKGVSTAYSSTIKKYGASSIYEESAATGGEYVDSQIATNTGNLYYSYLSSDWTAELWFNISTIDPIANSSLITLQRYSSGRGYFDIIINPTTITITHSTNGSNFDFNTTYNVTISRGAWHHLAIVKKNNIITVYIDGVAVVSNLSWSYSPNSSFSSSIVGRYSYCYIDEFRFSNIARWTSNFTPPTAPYA